MLQLVIGSSAVSLGVLLGTFMGGMCLGSLALPRIIGPRRHPLRVYASLELGIGAIGVLLLFQLLPFYDEHVIDLVTRFEQILYDTPAGADSAFGAQCIAAF